MPTALKKRTICRNGWLLAGRLGMGAESAVARYSSDLFPAANGRRRKRI